MLPISLIAILIFTLSPLSARTWKSASGDKSFEANYISNDGEQITLQRGESLITFSIEKLHSSDRAWLLENHPAQKEKPKAPPQRAAFDTLTFGDTKKEVTAKLEASEMLESSLAAVMMTRIGMNGVYRTKETIGGLHCYLYFDWDDQMKLTEVTLRTKAQPLSSYKDQLKSNWSALIGLLTEIHGAQVQGAPYPSANDLEDGLILGSHLWRTEHGDSVLLGTGQEGTQYSVIVRITSNHIKANFAK